jgi:E3 ubiquitin-protein ligase UHRF1
MPTEWDKQRLANIKRNRLVLESLDIERPAVEPKQAKRAPAKKRAVAKRAASEDTQDDEQPRKVQRVVPDADADADGAGAGPRRSGRNAGKAVDYKGESAAAAQRNAVEPVSVKARRESNYGGGPEGREDGKRVHNP